MRFDSRVHVLGYCALQLPDLSGFLNEQDSLAWFCASKHSTVVDLTPTH